MAEVRPLARPLLKCEAACTEEALPRHPLRIGRADHPPLTYVPGHLPLAVGLADLL